MGGVSAVLFAIIRPDGRLVVYASAVIILSKSFLLCYIEKPFNEYFVYFEFISSLFYMNDENIIN